MNFKQFLLHFLQTIYLHLTLHDRDTAIPHFYIHSWKLMFQIDTNTTVIGTVGLEKGGIVLIIIGV